MIQSKEYMECNTISSKLLYLSSMISAANEHLKMLEDHEDYHNIDIHLFNVTNDLEIAVNELYNVYEEIRQKENDFNKK